MKLSSAIGSFGSAFVASLVLARPAVAAVQAPQTVVSYTFAGTTGTPASTATGVSASGFIRDGSADTFYDNTVGNPAPDANSSGWTTSTTPDSAEYYTFTVTPAAGGASWNGITLDVADFDAASIDDGPTRFAVRSSLDGFTSNLLTGTVGTSFSTDTAALAVATTAPVEYRIYGFGAGTTQGLFQIDNVALTEAAPVPEPSRLAVFGSAALLAYLVATRRRA